jgi:outer membrane biosynthesis protein TonB
VPAPEPERLPPNAIASAGPFVPAAAVTRAVMEPPPPPEGPKPPPPAPKPVAVAPKPAPPPPKPAPPPKVVAKAEKPAPKAAPAPKPQPPPKVIAAAPTKQAPRRPTAVTPKTVTVAAAPAPLKPAQASRQAASLYAAKRFDEASATLARATEADPNLRAVARDYAAVGAGLARGDASAQSNPMAAMAAYSDALRADQRSGKGQHQKTLRAKLAQVAPRAAVAFLDAGRLESARASADLAAANGSANDPNVKAVRVGLEAKARELFNRGQELSRSQPEAARTLWRRVMKIVPDESPWYEKADAALSKAGMSDGIDL